MSANNTSGSVLIRADGSKAIGMGHLSRACLIANMLKSHFGLLSKIIVRRDPLAQDFLRGRGVGTIDLLPNISVAEEIKIVAGLLKKEKPRLFVVDTLIQESEADYTGSFKDFCPVLAITDDSYRRELDADVILNGNPGQIGLDYSSSRGTYLLGPQYFLMDPGHGQAQVKRPDGNIARVLISLGGSDHNDLLFRVLNALEKAGKGMSLLVVTTKASGYLDRLRSRLSGFKLPAELLIDVKSLAPLWKTSDLAITAGGNTLFERVASRLPGGTFCQLERQKEIAEAFVKLGVNFNLGYGPETSDDDLVKGIEDLLSDAELHVQQYENSPGVVDGQALNRLADQFGKFLVN